MIQQQYQLVDFSEWTNINSLLIHHFDLQIRLKFVLTEPILIRYLITR